MAGGMSQAGTVVVMPMWKRASITGVQLIMTMLTAGVIIGYGQLYPILIDSKVYFSKCKNEVIVGNTCSSQTAALDNLFNIGASVSIFVQAPSGIILDFLGPRITCWAGLLLFIPGCFLFAFAEQIHAIDAYMVGFQLLAAGGPFVFISALPVNQLWPDKQAMILMMINGVYGGGAFVFFLFGLLFDHANVSMKDLFIGYGVLGGLMVVVAGFVWPRRNYRSSSSSSSLSPSKADEPTVLEIIQKTLKDIMSLHYVFLAGFVALLILKSNFFLGTYETQFSYYMTDKQQNLYTTMFGVVLPGIGILAGPVGIFFDKFGADPAMILLICLSTLCSLCGLTVFFSNTFFVVSQVIRMFVFSFYYPMIYGVWAYALEVRYGNTNFGVLYGIIAVIAGILNITTTNALNRKSLHEHSYVFANILFAALGFAFIVVPIISILRRRVYRSKYGSGYYEPIIN